MDLELRDKTFLITGGTDGVGLALAERLVEEGAGVAVCGRDQARLDEAQAVLGAGALCVRADVTDPGALDLFIDMTLARYGRLDGAVNNAGTSSSSSVAASTDDLWRTDYELKVIAALHVSRRVVPLLEATNGVILNVLATGARTPGANSGPTTASRAAGLALTKALASEAAPRGVRVNAILIGLIESGQWVRRAKEGNLELAAFYTELAKNARIPLGRVGRADEFADLASYLLSQRASYVTGVGISLDGGLSPVI
jgi:NAD(P)-dependent dehydrogenase (short-subunit alcohol dehydrogenase family)